jgi:hypothetical protein
MEDLVEITVDKFKEIQERAKIVKLPVTSLHNSAIDIHKNIKNVTKYKKTGMYIGAQAQAILKYIETLDAPLNGKLILYIETEEGRGNSPKYYELPKSSYIGQEGSTYLNRINTKKQKFQIIGPGDTEVPVDYTPVHVYAPESAIKKEIKSIAAATGRNSNPVVPTVASGNKRNSNPVAPTLSAESYKSPLRGNRVAGGIIIYSPHTVEYRQVEKIDPNSENYYVSNLREEKSSHLLFYQISKKKAPNGQVYIYNLMDEPIHEYYGRVTFLPKDRLLKGDQTLSLANVNKLETKVHQIIFKSVPKPHLPPFNTDDRYTPVSELPENIVQLPWFPDWAFSCMKDYTSRGWVRLKILKGSEEYLRKEAVQFNQLWNLYANNKDIYVLTEGSKEIYVIRSPKKMETLEARTEFSKVYDPVVNSSEDSMVITDKTTKTQTMYNLEEYGIGLFAKKVDIEAIEKPYFDKIASLKNKTPLTMEEEETLICAFPEEANNRKIPSPEQAYGGRRYRSHKHKKRTHGKRTHKKCKTHRKRR